MRVGIVVEDWKLTVFRKQLTKAGFTYEDGGAPMPNTTTLIVVTDDAGAVKLTGVVQKCQNICAEKRKP